MEIETYYKFHKKGDIKVIINYFEYPHLADLKIKNDNE